MERRRIVGWLLVAVQMALFATLLLLPRGEHWPLPALLEVLALGLVVGGLLASGMAALALGSALTPTPQPRRDSELRTGGPYRWVRHPIYGGLLIAVAGWTLWSRSWVTVAVSLATIVFFAGKARWEEQLLAERYPEYPARFRGVPRFLPLPWRTSAGDRDDDSV